MAETEDTTLDPMSSDDRFPMMEMVNSIISKYAWIITGCFGVPGNCIAMLVITLKHNRKLSPCVYIAAMAVADNVVLLNNFWYYPIAQIGLGKDIVEGREVMFKFNWYFAYTGGITSGLFLAEMTVDRLLAVAFPIKARTMCTASRAVKTVAVTAVAVIVININLFFTHELIKEKTGGGEILVVRFPKAPIVEHLVNGFQLIFGTVIPFAIVLCCNVAIILLLHRAQKARQKLGTEHIQKKPDDGNDKKFLARMLILVSIAYVLTSIPYRMFTFITGLPSIAKNYKMAQAYWSLRYSIENYVFGNIWYYNYALNFYLYCIGGGKRYRQDTKLILLSCMSCVRKRYRED